MTKSMEYYVTPIPSENNLGEGGDAPSPFLLPKTARTMYD